MDVSDEGRWFEIEMRENQEKYDETLRVEKIERAKINQSFVDKLSDHCHKRKEHISRLHGFWFKAIKAHPDIGRQLNAIDSEIFEKHLTSIEIVYEKDSESGFMITFDFTENEYFSNGRIFKRFNLRDGDLISTESSCIHWIKDIPDIVCEERDEDEEDDGTSESKLTSQSFFNWFTSTSDEEELSDGDHLADAFEMFWIDPLKYLQGDDDDTEDEVDG